MIYPIQKTLFFENPELEELMSRVELDMTQSGALHSGLNKFLKFTSNELPIVNPYQKEIPVGIMQYCKTKKLALAREKGICPHHFVADRFIEPLWTKLSTHIHLLQRIGWTVSPDLSILAGMTREQKFINDFRNKFLSALYQLCGIDVIPAPAWCDLENIDHYMDGWPQNSIVAINSTGVCRDRRSIHLWLDGYHAMLERITPTHILRYGGFIEGEREDISTYYSNENEKGGIYGI